MLTEAIITSADVVVSLFSGLLDSARSPLSVFQVCTNLASQGVFFYLGLMSLTAL